MGGLGRLLADWLHYALAWIGTIALVVPRATLAILGAPFLPASLIGTGLGVILTALGVAIAARITLAGNWSAQIEIKKDHMLIRSGPYR